MLLETNLIFISPSLSGVVRDTGASHDESLHQAGADIQCQGVQLRGLGGVKFGQDPVALTLGGRNCPEKGMVDY